MSIMGVISQLLSQVAPTPHDQSAIMWQCAAQASGLVGQACRAVWGQPPAWSLLSHHCATSHVLFASHGQALASL